MVRCVASLAFVCGAWGDDILYRYECDVLPYDPSAGWIIADPCSGVCTESLEDGHFVLRWTQADNFANYDIEIANPTHPPPSTLWVEWNFRSNHPIGPYFDGCDAFFAVSYSDIYEVVKMYGNAAFSFSGDYSVGGLSLEDFHLYRFESSDGVHYTIAVDGEVFITGTDHEGNGYSYLQMRGEGGCTLDEFPNMKNEWDFVRYGTIARGERVVSSAPSVGFVDARVNPALDRFTVTYDAPNYVYIAQVSASVLDGSSPPHVIATRRLDNGAPDTVEVVLDRPIPYNKTTRFTFNDGVATDIVEFTYAPGDTNGDGQTDLADFAAFQNCFGAPPPAGVCMVLDFDGDSQVDDEDFGRFSMEMNPP